MLVMLCDALGLDGQALPPALAQLWPHQAVREELQQLVYALGDLSTLREERLDRMPRAPLALHGAYTGTEALLALGYGSLERSPARREGVRWVDDANADALFVTLRKSEKSFSPTTMYRDYAISRTLFHWESQNSTHEATEVGQRYINHAAVGSDVLLFVRETEKRANGAGAPFTCLGPVTYESHEGGRPMQITWRLENPLPEALLETSQLIAAA
jgi:hypothetical protein